MDEAECPPSYQALGLDTPIDRWQNSVCWLPSRYILHSRIAPAGLAVDAATNDAGAHHREVVYGMTPVNASHIHYFFSMGREFAHDDVAVELLNDWQGPPQEVSIKIDSGGRAGRRVLASLIGNEQHEFC